jgi:hypothetical protein
MIIALDYDGTYTADPVLWDAFIRNAHLKGHQVHVVTMRHESEPVRMGEQPARIHYTDRKAKLPYMAALGLAVQIWIDDRPDFILQSAAPRSLEENAKSLIWAGEA